MSKEVDVLDKKLPAHLQALKSDPADAKDEWSSGTASGFPVLSTKGKVWAIKRGDSTDMIVRENSDGEEEPAQSISVVVLRSNKGVARTYYKDKYVQGSDDPPTCYSNDGIKPAMDAEDRQAKTCAACPNSKWGSVITENGKKGKACSEVKRLAVAPVGQLNDPLLLRIPPTSLKEWDKYVDMLIKRSLNPTQVMTKVSFDPNVAHQLFVFKATGFITEEMAEEIQTTLQLDILESIIGVENDTAGHAAETDAAPEEPARPAKQAAKKPAKSATDETEDDDSEEDAPPPPPKKKRAPAKKKAPEPEPEGDDEEGDDDDDIPELDLDDLDLDDDSDDA